MINTPLFISDPFRSVTKIMIPIKRGEPGIATRGERKKTAAHGSGIQITILELAPGTGMRL